MKASFSSLVHRLFLMEFIAEFVLIFPFYAILIGQRQDVQAAGLGILLATYQITSVVAEIPTGIIADKISKKWSLVMSKSLVVIAFTLWYVMPNFIGFFLGFFLWGVGTAFQSGAFQAYLYETLTDEHKKGFNKIYARLHSVTMLAYMLSYIVSFFIGPQYNILILCSILVSVISLAICLSLPETKTHKDIEIKPEIFKTAVQNIKRSSLLQHLLIGAVLICAVDNMIVEFMPVYYQQVGVLTQYVPLLLALGNAITVVIYWTFPHYEKKFVKYQVLIIGIATGLFILSFHLPIAVVLIGIYIFTRVSHLIQVSNESAIQHMVEGQVRATVSSIYSFMSRILAGVLLTIVGFLAVDNQIVTPIRWVIVGLVVVYILSQYYLTKRSYSVKLHAK